MNSIQGFIIRFLPKFISIVLTAGGVLGIIASMQMVAHFVPEGRWDRLAVALISIPVFGWCCLKGIDLWRGKASGYRWATLLFLLQIPAVCISRVTYEFSTGISARVLFGQTNRWFGANIGSSLNLLVSPGPLGWLLGINLFAVAVVVCLFVVMRQQNRLA